MSKLDIDQLENQFPMNETYIKGECYLNWSRATTECSSNFTVECSEIDSSLIISANASTNRIVLIDNTTLDNLPFTIRPTFPDNSLKLYGIGSSRTENGINISIINYDTEEENNEQ